MKGVVSCQKRFSAEEKLAVIREVEAGGSIREVCAEHGVSKESYRKWKIRYLREGKAGLESSRPGEEAKARPPVGESVVDPKTLGLILTEKARHPLVGIRSFSALLKHHHKVLVSPSTLARIFERHGIARVSSGNGKPYEALDAFEHPFAMDAWQLDWHRFRISGRGPYWVLGAIDDRSRYLVALELSKERTAAAAIEILRRAFSELGPPRELITDNGAELVGKDFTSFLREQSVVHVRASSHRPTTLGKQERLWQTLERELLLVTWLKDEEDACEKLAAWREYYNTQRPHLSLDGKTPAEVFFARRRPEGREEAKKKSSLTIEAVLNGRRLRVDALGPIEATIDGEAMSEGRAA